MEIIIGIGEYAISNNEDDVIKTHALGSCVALTVYSPNKKVLGMVHIALPDSKINPDISRVKPGHFADTAIPTLLEKFYYEYGCKMNELIFKLYGGAQSIHSNDSFEIGRRNIDATLEILTLNNLSYDKLETGGFISRTIEVDVGSGSAKIFKYPIRRYDLY